MKTTRPVHVAIIMDGNRRWAKKNGLGPIEGHRKGIDALIKTTEESAKLGIKYLTVYALSTENYKNRSREEVGAILKLIEEGVTKHLPRLKKEGVRLNCIGDLDALPAATKLAINRSIGALSKGKRGVLNVAINYGGRDEIIKTAKKLAEKNLPFTEEEFEKNLFTEGMPDPNLVIRTGGCSRLSNFLLWQTSYSELYFSDTLWPDFGEREFKKIVDDYSERIRNFGR